MEKQHKDLMEDRPVNTDFKILKFSIQQNNDIVKNLKLGTYSSTGMYFNPYNFEFETLQYKRKDEIKKDNMSLMGSEDPTRYPLKLDPDTKQVLMILSKILQPDH